MPLRPRRWAKLIGMSASPDVPATATLDGGLRVRVTGPKGEVASDMAAAAGGGESAPTPGWYLRAALASCDATVIAMEADRAGIRLSRLTVTVESESDARGVLGSGDVPAGPVQVHIRVDVAADGVGEDELRELVARAEERSAVRDALTRAVPTTTEVAVG